jgi:hypothetical protein
MRMMTAGGVAAIPMCRTWHLGFVRLKKMVRVDSIFHSQYYDHDLDGMVFDYANGFDLYIQKVADADTQAASATSIKTSINTTQTICELLPEEDATARHMTKRFTIGRRKQR